MSDITANVVVSMPSQLFTMARSFKAVSNGKIYIGIPDTDPTIPSNQIQVYLENEDGTHIPIPQPIAINSAGFPVYNGQISKFVTVRGHSMAVLDSYNVQQFYYPNVLKYDPDQLRQELSSPGGVDLVNGAAKQESVDALNDQNDSFSYIESFSSLAVGDDWSDAIQAAFNTGKVVVGKTDKTYKVSKIINSQGQAFIGKLSLQLTRSSIPAATVSAFFTIAESNTFRGIYVQSAYDLCELLRIKSMGFNTLLHYCYFDNNGTIDADGTIPQLVKNAATAGLNVVVNTQNSSGHGHGTVADVINSVDAYTNVIGYSIIDEPGSGGHSLADQEAAISTARALTKKKLYSVDFIWRLNTWTKPWSYNYDVFLVDSYSMYYASGTAAEKLNKDLSKMRTDIGAAMKMTGNARVIPCFQAYAHPETTPVEGISGSYAFDVDQIVAASRVFGKVGNGDFACFVWDGGMEINASNNSKIQSMIKDVVNHAGKGEQFITEAMIFGGVGSVYQRSLHDILGKVQVRDPGNSVDSWLGGGAWPVRLITGSSETPIRTTTANINISGIAFNKSFSRLVTKQNARQYVTAFGVFENYGTSLTGTATLNLYTTPDGGYIENTIYSGGVTGGSPFRLSSKTTNAFDGVGEDLVIGIALSNSSDYMDNYRRFIYGMFVSTNW